MEFPKTRPKGANFIRPEKGEALHITPPGFCWWRAAGRDVCHYRLIVDRGGSAVYESPFTPDPIHVPDRVFPPGAYTWQVEASVEDTTKAVSERRAFTIAAGAAEQPWVDPAELLAQVPAERPRLLFLASEIAEVRKTLSTTRAEAFECLVRKADSALNVDPPSEPDYDRIEDPAERRLAYVDSFAKLRQFHIEDMRSLALSYVLTGERKYGEAARRFIVDAARWDPEGISSILAPYGDEIGLKLTRAAAEVFDWIHDVLSEEDRELVSTTLGARADQMIRRLDLHDHTFTPENSHDGRLPAYLLEHAVALVEDPRAAGWAEYALKIIATNFPHWAGRDGGWAQGVKYGLIYNIRDSIPFESWRKATGHDIWLKPYYRKMPWFFYYQISPLGELMPFCDYDDTPIGSPMHSPRSRTLLQFHGLRLGSHRIREHAGHVLDEHGQPAGVDPYMAILFEDKPLDPETETIPQDRAFHGVGWGSLHSDIENPESDLMVAFRSSPYGGVSHGHASQNDFMVMKGGRARSR